MTHPSSCFAGSLVVLFAIAAPAAAQDDPRFALLASFPSPTVSFQWELTERFAIRVEGAYSFRDESLTESSGDDPELTGGGSSQVIFIPINTESTSESTYHSGSIGVAGLFTIHRNEHVRLYVAPRLSVGFTNQRTTITTTATGLPPGLPPRLLEGLLGTQTYESSSTSPGGGVLFGAASNVHRRLALFGEVGVTYARTDAPLATIVGISTSRDLGDSKRTTINTRAVGGLMILF